MASWNASAKIEPVAQQYQDLCGAACVQMILGGMGLRGLGPGAQKLLDDSINLIKGPVKIGNPVGVACTINRYNSGESDDVQHPSPPSKEFRMSRSATPYDACALITNALHRYQSPAAVQVLGGQHWLVVFGADGQGDPRDGSYTVDTFMLCNPDNGRFGGLPQDPNPLPNSIGFCIERITYANFVVLYLTGTYYRTLPCQEYGDGGKFIIVTDRRAQQRGLLLPPTPEILPPTQVPAPIDGNAVRSQIGSEDWVATAQQRRPLLVKRLDQPNEYYYLVPFALKDGGVNLVRLSATGTYLGTGFCGGTDAALFDDEQPLGFRRATATLSLSLEEGAHIADDVLVWHPSAESASPYRPFRVFKDKAKTVFASLEGTVLPELHDRETNATLDPAQFA